MLFWKDKKRAEDVEPTLLERLQRIEAKLNKHDAEILDVITATDIIRNKVLRKIQHKKDEEEPEEPKDLYSKVLLPEK